MRRCSYYLVLTLYLAGISASQQKENPENPQGTTVYFASRALQGFTLRVWLSNQMNLGLQAWDCENHDCMSAWPKAGMSWLANFELLHVMAPIIGGKMDGIIRVDEGYNPYSGKKDFIPDYWSLPREHFWRTSKRDTYGVPNRRYCDDDGDGKVDEDDLDGNDNDGDWDPIIDDVGSDGLADHMEFSCTGIPFDSIINPDPAGDNYDPGEKDQCHPNYDGSLPYKDNRFRWTEHNGLPDHGEPNIDEDYAAVSELDLYCSATDTIQYPLIPSNVPMGIKCLQKSYAWDTGELTGVLPFDYYFINIGRKNITDVYIGFYVDMNIGPLNDFESYNRNHSAFMESLGTAYSYSTYGEGSPAGVTILRASLPVETLNLEWIPWCDISEGYRDNDSVLYTWMNGEAFPGSPISLPEPIPCNTRFLLSIGPFPVFEPGDTISLSIALVAGSNIDDGPYSLKQSAINAHKINNRDPFLPVRPESPKLDYTLGKQKVELKWYPHESALSGSSISPVDAWDDSSKLAESYPENHWRRINPPCGVIKGECLSHFCDDHGRLPGGRTFSGFRLYRNEYDQNDDWPSSGNFVLLREYVLPDTATEWSMSHMDSVFVDSNLSRDKTYWYAVTTMELPEITILALPQHDGTLKYDTIYSESKESSIHENRVRVDVPLSMPSEEAGKVLVVPNPYRVDDNFYTEYSGWTGPGGNWDDSKRLVKFIRLPKGEWTLRIFTLMGEKIAVIKNTMTNGYEQGGKFMEPYREDRAEISFDLLTESSRALASGVYIFLVDSDYGQQTGKFVLIR